MKTHWDDLREYHPCNEASGYLRHVGSFAATNS
jgi:hypothetical protein